MNQNLSHDEESAKTAVLLKRKELKWRLMQASQLQNRAKLEEIRVEANYNRQKMIRITALAAKLRAKYIKVARAARIAESLYKKIEYQLLTHEKFVADEKMQLTKLAMDCQNIGKKLYGPSYELVINSNAADEKRLALKLMALKRRLAELENKASINSPAKRVLAMAKAQASAAQMARSLKSIQNGNTSKDQVTLDVTNQTIEGHEISNSETTQASLNLQSSTDDKDSNVSKMPAIQTAKDKSAQMLKLAPFLRSRLSMNAGLKKNGSSSPINIPLTFIEELEQKKQQKQKKRRLPLSSPILSPLYDLRKSILKNLSSHRLTSKFFESGLQITDLNYTHNICPNDYICLPDLIGTCTDKNCVYQHKSNYIMVDIDKLVDILSYNPSVVGFETDSSLSEEENNKKCRVKLKEYAAKLIAKNPGKQIEELAQNLVKLVRANQSDQDLLTKTRVLSKISKDPATVTNVMKPSASNANND